ncbi:MAG: TonB family protein [Bacteroidia bacterium]
MSKDKKPKFLNKPFYQGGNEAFQAFIDEHLQYPEAALAARMEAQVKVQITMDHKGKVIEAKAMEKPGFGIEEEAVRVARLLRFTVNKNRGMRVTFSRTVTIPFRIPKSVPKPQAQRIAYSYRSSSVPKSDSKKQAPKPSKKIAYSYRINL